MKIRMSLPLDIEVQTSESPDTSITSADAMSLDTSATSVDTTAMLTEVCTYSLKF